MEQELKQQISRALTALYGIENAQVLLEPTKSDFEGDYTFVVFPYVKQSKKAPEQTANEIGQYLVEHVSLVSAFNVIKGFLNLSIEASYWIGFVKQNYSNAQFGWSQPNTRQKVLVEYSSPNTNKPLHLGHVRNNLLGYSVAQILKANGYDVAMCNLVNDRGIHICKSMYAWMQYGNGETPQSSGMKGDHLVGKYYVKFDAELKKETKVILENINKGDLEIFSSNEREEIIKQKDKVELMGAKRIAELERLNINEIIDDFNLDEIIPSGVSNKDINWKAVIKQFESSSEDSEMKLKELQKLFKPILSLEEKVNESLDALKDIAQNKTAALQAAKDLLRKWEANDPETVNTWKMMNGWVYEGFEITYKKMGVAFDKFYYESNTYLLGKEIVQEGLAKNVFFKKDDGSVWVDLTGDGLDQKLLLRGDGTSVYITQDIGTAELKYADFGAERSIYVVGNEQDYHFKVLQLICKKLGKSYADGIYHLSYGMVELPHGKMKSREGTVVDADDLIDEMVRSAEETTKALGKTEGLEEKELQELYQTIGLGALKYFLLKVDPRKKMLFNPEESIDFHGNTGPFIQYTYARIRSILRNAGTPDYSATEGVEMNELENGLAQVLYRYPEALAGAAQEMSPGLVANYIYDLAKTFSHFYHECPIIKEPDILKRNLRLQLCEMTANCIRSGFELLGIRVPERM